MSLVDNDNLPAPGTLAAMIDLGARLRVFDYDGSLTTASKQVWDLIEPDIRTISDAYRSEEHTSELQSLMRNSYAVFCLKKKTINHNKDDTTNKTSISEH